MRKKGAGTKQAIRTVRSKRQVRSGAAARSRKQSIRNPLYRRHYNNAYDQAYNKGFDDGYAKGLEDGAIADQSAQ